MNKIPGSENTVQSQAGGLQALHTALNLYCCPLFPLTLCPWPSVTQSCTEWKAFKSFLPCSGRLRLCSLTQGSSPVSDFAGYTVPLFSLAQLIALLIDKILCVSLKGLGERKEKSQQPRLQKQSSKSCSRGNADDKEVVKHYFA